MSGQLFVFEGPDEVGKTTLARMLSRSLAAAGTSASAFSFPGTIPGTLGELVYRIHHQTGTPQTTPTSLQALHVAAHIDLVQKHLNPLLDGGATVILDRYWWSTRVYGRYANVSAHVLDALIALELSVWTTHKPVVFLVSRHSSQPDLTSLYDVLATEQADHSDIVRIDNNSTIEDAFAKVWSATQKRLAVIPKAKGRRISTNISPAEPSQAFDTYWRFAAERQELFFRRLEGVPEPWTRDPIFKRNKFTNAYRASDRTSQFLIRNVIYEGDQDFEQVFYRTILFKFFNRIETWQYLNREFKQLRYEPRLGSRLITALNRAKASGKTIYSGAYIMPSGASSFSFPTKHEMHIRLLDTMMKDELPARLASCSNMSQAFELIRAYPTIGDFLAYQFITDLNYSAGLSFSEMEFTVAGPGALGGIEKCFKSTGGLTYSEIISLMCERQEFEFHRLGLRFRNLWGRRLQLIDCQNLFCEVDKYSRVFHPELRDSKGRERIKQRFSPKSEPISYWYPPKWGINSSIPKGLANVQLL